MKTLVTLASVILLTISGQFVSAKSQNGQFATTEYFQSVQEKQTNTLSLFYCTITVDGTIVMKGIAEGYSARELEERLKVHYTGIFREGNDIPKIKVTCTPVEKK